MQVTHGHGLSPLGADAGHPLAERDSNGQLGDVRRQAGLRDQLEKAVILDRAMEGAGARIELAGDFFNSPPHAVLSRFLCLEDGVESFNQLAGFVHDRLCGCLP